MEGIPYDEPADLVAISVETYTARRAYQIASEYRKRGVPVVMGGFHATLVPEEVSDYAESILIGEAETLWPEVIEDFERRAFAPRLPPGREALARWSEAGPFDLLRQAIPAHRARRGRAGLPVPVRVLRHTELTSKAPRRGVPRGRSWRRSAV